MEGSLVRKGSRDNRKTRVEVEEGKKLLDITFDKIFYREKQNGMILCMLCMCVCV